jgi:hypothetical protein
MERAQTHGKGLQERHGVLHVHGELIFAHPTVLHDDVFVLGVV